MNKLIAIALVMLAMSAWASEEDYAAITAIRIEAMTTENTFGRVIVSATFTNGMEGTIFTSLAVDAGGKTLTAPAEQLQDAARVYPASIMVSSEVGYPDDGLGPYVSVHYNGYDGTAPAKYSVVFDSNGFKGIDKERIQQGVPPYSAQSAPPGER